MSSEGTNSEHLTTREFQNFRLDVKEEFKEVHECTKRIEDKIDEFMEKAGPVFNEYRQQNREKQELKKKNWDLKKAVAVTILTVVGSVATTAIIVLLRLH